MSIWESDAQRKADALKRKEAEAVSLSNRQGIQEEALSGRKLLSLETKRLERKRQLDQQRGDIHPEAVQAPFQALKEQHTPSASAPRKTVGFLPPAIPEDDQPGSTLAPLPVRNLGKDDD